MEDFLDRPWGEVLFIAAPIIGILAMIPAFFACMVARMIAPLSEEAMVSFTIGAGLGVAATILALKAAYFPKSFGNGPKSSGI